MWQLSVAVAGCRLQFARPFMLLCGWQVKAATVRTVLRRPYLRALYSRDLDCIGCIDCNCDCESECESKFVYDFVSCARGAAEPTHTAERDNHTHSLIDTDTDTNRDTYTVALVALATVADAVFVAVQMLNGKLFINQFDDPHNMLN